MKILIQLSLLISLSIVNLPVKGQITRAMSFNIRYDNPGDKENWWENRKNDVIGLIEYYHPDFIGIQEGLNNQVDFINKNTSNYDYIGVGRDDGAKKGEYTAIYYDTTKFELVETKTFWLSDTPDTVSVGWDASMERICTYGEFMNKKTKESLFIFNSHFDHIGTAARIKSAKLIVDKIQQYGLLKMKVMVMGDFNSGPLSKPIKTMIKELDDGLEISQKAFFGPAGTFNGFDNNIVPNKRIDYILTKNIEVVRYRHIDDKRNNNLCISDHLPVLIDIRNTTTNNKYKP
jgi:endonuclease/exonuclease/phosphatase family metal-dependent hydrolase